MRQLIRRQILPAMDNEFLRLAGDAAALPAVRGPLAMTTDSFVVSPLFFPGGDIGSLAVYGTVNDLAVAGARPRWISLALILEEGLEIAVLARVLNSVAAAARRVGVLVVTGDTKVVPRGAADKLFINTTGIGEFLSPPPAGPQAIEVGDELIVTGPIGCHGMAVMAAREGIEFDPPPRSDSAPLVDAIVALREGRDSAASDARCDAGRRWRRTARMGRGQREDARDRGAIASRVAGGSRGVRITGPRSDPCGERGDDGRGRAARLCGAGTRNAAASTGNGAVGLHRPG